MHSSFGRVHVVGRLTVAGIMGVVVLGSLLTIESPTVAATNPPWRFTTVNQVFDWQPGNGDDVALKCPFGYRPVSGGIARDAANPDGDGVVYRLSEYTDPAHRTFR